jgi:hypothetical protein
VARGGAPAGRFFPTEAPGGGTRESPVRGRPGANQGDYFRPSYGALWPARRRGNDVLLTDRLSENLPPPGKGHSTQLSLLMRKRHLNGLLIVAILLISTAPLYAQRQQQNVAKLKEDARDVVGTIANDKAKTQTYCQILDLARQLEQAVQEKDRKKVKTLAEKIGQLQKQLGPEFVALMNGLMHIDRRSPDSQEIALIMESLDQSCPD